MCELSGDQVKPGDIAMMVAFANAGDPAGAAVLRCGGRPK